METKEIGKSELNKFMDELFDTRKNDNCVFRGYCNNNELLPSLVGNYDKLNLKMYLLMKRMI